MSINLFTIWNLTLLCHFFVYFHFTVEPKSSRGNKRLPSRSWANRNISSSTARRRVLLVGVVTNELHLQPTMTDVAATWGQGSKDLLFYSLHWSKTALRKGSSQQKVQFSKKVRYKRSNKDDGDGTLAVVTVDTYKKKKAHSMGGELTSILQHMYASQSDSYDWFAIIPSNTYIRIEDIEQLLAEKDSSSYTILGSPASSKDGTGGSCDDSVGVVLSRTMLSAVGSLMQPADSKGGSGEDAAVACKKEDYTSFSCLTQKLGVECTHDYQVRMFTHAFALSSLNSCAVKSFAVRRQHSFFVGVSFITR